MILEKDFKKKKKGIIHIGVYYVDDGDQNNSRKELIKENRKKIK